jgi:hypothetical protein
MVATLEAVKLYLSRLLSRNAAPAVTACAGTAADLGAFDSPATALVMPLARARMRRGRAVLGKEVTLLTTLRHTPLAELDETVERLKVETPYAELRKAFIDLIALAPLEDLGALKHVYLEHLADDAGDYRG